MKLLLVPLILFLACGDLFANEKAVPVSAPRVEYPYEARVRRMEGFGMYLLHLDAKGSVTRVEIVKTSGHAMLDAEAIITLQRWRFKPGPKKVRFPVTWSLGAHMSNRLAPRR